MFYPQPKIDSIITRLKPKRSPSFELRSEVSFQRFLQVLFTRRNRTVRNAALAYLKEAWSAKKDAIQIADSLPLGDRRVRELTPEDIGALANVITK